MRTHLLADDFPKRAETKRVTALRGYRAIDHGRVTLCDAQHFARVSAEIVRCAQTVWSAIDDAIVAQSGHPTKAAWTTALKRAYPTWRDDEKVTLVFYRDVDVDADDAPAELSPLV
jgi:hypothetical protein